MNPGKAVPAPTSPRSGPHLEPVSWHLRKLELLVLPHRAQPPGSNVLRLAEGLARWAPGLPLLAIAGCATSDFPPSSCACLGRSQTTGISGRTGDEGVHVPPAACRRRAGHLLGAQHARQAPRPASKLSSPKRPAARSARSPARRGGRSPIQRCPGRKRGTGLQGGGGDPAHGCRRLTTAPLRAARSAGAQPLRDARRAGYEKGGWRGAGP